MLFQGKFGIIEANSLRAVLHMETKEYVVQKLMLLSISNNLEIKVNNKEEILSTKDISDLTNEFKEYIELLQLTLNLTSNDLCEMLKISIGTLKSLKGITNKGRRMRTSSLKNSAVSYTHLTLPTIYSV